ncbi:MAG: hypothetical protein ACI4Q3_00050 [Kiritimatiellia bacterium]
MTMGVGEFTKSGVFIAIVLLLVVALMPFALEQVGEMTGRFKFPAKKTLAGILRQPAATLRVPKADAVDWVCHRQTLEEFSAWLETLPNAVVRPPPYAPAILRIREEDACPVRRLWLPPVAGCTAGEAALGRKGYVYLSGRDGIVTEGARIAPSESLCGYELVFVGERSVWLRAVFADAADAPMGVVKLPEFTRVDAEGARLIRGGRLYAAHDAFALATGGWLMVDSFLPPNGAVFRVLNGNRQVIATLLCVVIGEKGDGR